MKVLIVHNDYQKIGGEHHAVNNQIKLLESKGHEVIYYSKDNRAIDSYSKKQLAEFIPNTIYSTKSYSEITKIIRLEKPDLAHVHNVFPIISPSIYYALRDNSIPIVQTIHNFRFLCPNGLLFINNKVCELCKYGNTSYAMVKKCYHESYPFSFLYAITVGGHRIARSFKLIDRFISLTEFSANKLIEGKFVSAKKISILGNFIPSPLPVEGLIDERENSIVYIGRLSKEKGVDVLLKAGRSLPNVKILILGEGPEKQELSHYKNANDLKNVEFLGYTTGEKKWKILRNAMAVVIPSVCYENFSLTAIESMSVGTPVIASRLGSLPYVVEDGKSGLLFEPGNSLDLIDKLIRLKMYPELRSQLGRYGRKTVEERYSESVQAKKLMRIYGEVTD